MKNYHTKRLHEAVKKLHLKNFCIKRYLILASVCMVVVSCTNNNHKGYKKKNFDSLINIVDRNHAGELNGTDELIEDSAFSEIFDHSPTYFDDVIKLLAKKEINQRKAYYCVFAMQNLKLDEYIRLCNIYKKLYDNNKIPEYTLERLIGGGFLEIRVIKDHNSNPDVIRFLNEMHDDKKVSKDFKNLLEEILSA
jgi:hypothetical protein